MMSRLYSRDLIKQALLGVIALSLSACGKMALKTELRDPASVLLTPDASVSAVEVLPLLVPDGQSKATIRITIRSSNSTPIAGIVPTIAVTGSGNGIGTCSVTDADGISTCTLTSTVAETKNITVTYPVSLSATAKYEFGRSGIPGVGLGSGGSQASSAGFVLKGSAGLIESAPILKDGSGNQRLRAGVQGLIQ